MGYGFTIHGGILADGLHFFQSQNASCPPFTFVLFCAKESLRPGRKSVARKKHWREKNFREKKGIAMIGGFQMA
ncbi:MAG: hypothetical protein AMJ94_02620 [Deltaproteobacteria bacterium SM23_61]|nr:MAG: hypothetical protein AMJ94_02620 [Deltaproteobacteria bacterium SM23_61]